MVVHRLAVLMRSTSSPILVHIGLGAAPQQAYIEIAPGKKFCGEARLAVGIGRRMVGYASCLQTHLFFVCQFVCLSVR